MTTNNRMELLAVIIGLEAIKKSGWQVEVVCDSRYVVDAVEKGWLKNWVKKAFKGKKNVDLWKRYLEAAKIHQVKFKWIKGHAGHLENERCDHLAVTASKGIICQLITYLKKKKCPIIFYYFKQLKIKLSYRGMRAIIKAYLFDND